VAIDDPLEKIRELAADDKVDFGGASLQLAGISVSPVFKVFAIAKSIFDSQLNGNAIKIAILALCDELQRLQNLWPSNFEGALNAEWFRRAVAAVMEESVSAANNERARLLGRVAAHGCFPTGKDAHRQEDLASYIHDLAQLGTDDIQFLRLLKDSYEGAYRTAPNMNKPDIFAGYYDDYKHKAQELNISEDDRIALGARLGGFGLAYEPPVQPFPGQHFVRATLRGLYLLSLLDAAELPIEKQY